MSFEPGARAPARVPVFATWIIVAALFLQEVMYMRAEGSNPFIALLLAAAATAAYVLWQHRILTNRRSDPRLVAAISVLSLAAFQVGDAWAALPMMLAAIMMSFELGRMLLVLTPTLLVIAALTRLNWGPGYTIELTVGVLAMGITLHAFTYIALLVRELQLAREQMARTKVDEERLRIQRDLHDVLGRTLVAASMRNQVALRVLPPEAESARDQLTQLHTVLIEGQARLREITSGPVIVSLADELTAAQAMLNARLGIRVTVDGVALTPGPVEKLAGAVVRECTTNMLKHARVSEASITVRQEPLSVVTAVVNDGVDLGAGTDPNLGTGLAHLARLAADLGGSVTAEHLSGSRFRVVCRVPRDDLPADQPLATEAAGAVSVEVKGFVPYER